MQQIHWVAYLRERLGTLFGFLLARRYMRNAHQSPLIAEALDRLRARIVSKITSSKGTMGWDECKAGANAPRSAFS